MNRYALVGFMAAGKSAVGREISQLLNTRFIDLDEQIEQEAKCSISDIFRAGGERAFREIEQFVLSKVTNQYTDCVLATGGGAVSNSLNRAILKLHWRCIYLRVAPEVVLQRVRQDGDTRPLLANVANPFEHIQDLLMLRNPWYEDVAQLQYDVSNKSIWAIAQDILADIRE